MISAVWLGVGLVLLAADGTSGPDLRAYASARDHVGRDAEAQVKLALWCEAHGLTAERIKHLALAVMVDPANATARGLMGLVDFQGRWERPEAVRDRLRRDEAAAARLAEYNARREALADTADAHYELARWCEQHGLAPEAKAHYVTVTRLDPSRDAAWKHLGLRKVDGRWVTDEQLASERAEADAQRQADRRWKPRLTHWLGMLRDRDPKTRAAASEALAGIDDPRAVPMLWAVFANGDAIGQTAVVPVLARIDGAGSGRALAMLAVFGHTPEVRRAATETLRLRDGREFIGLLVEAVRKPLRYELRPSDNGLAELHVEGEQARIRRVYLQPAGLQRAIASIPPRLFDASVPFDPYGVLGMNAGWGNGPGLGTTAAGTAAAVAASGVGGNGQAGVRPINPNEVAAARDREIAFRLERIQNSLETSRQEVFDDVAEVEAMNASAVAFNERVLPVLEVVTDQRFGASPDDWKAWWADQRGYVYQKSTSAEKPVVTTFVSTASRAGFGHSCFAAGTTVRTLEGVRPIESIQVGDQVLAQDAKTGRLKYSPVVAVFHNRPAETFRLDAGGQSVFATAIHRFWKAGHGWVMLRDLKPGDMVRTLGGRARVTAVETGRVEPVFNLEVADGRSFFVGDGGLLVHDNSTVIPVEHPFDAPPDLAALEPASRGE